MNITVLSFDTIDSTNSEASRQARLGAKEGICVVANQQTAGRGRHGRSWVSEKNAGLYFSIVLRPTLETKYLPIVTLMAGVAVHDTLTEFGIKPDIKWVNDILVNEQKISGILAETAETTEGLAVIVGVGINIRSLNFPDDIVKTATSIEDAMGASVSRDELLETLTKYFSYFYAVLDRGEGPRQIIEEWRKRSSYFSGKTVRVVLGNETITGITDGLESNGALRVKGIDGISIIQAGDVEKLRTDADDPVAGQFGVDSAPRSMKNRS